MGKSWPSENIDTLTELVRMGLSAGQIGLAMGISRSSASGKIARVRKVTGDETLRVGLTSGRIGKSHDGGYQRIKRRTAEEIAAASRARWERWESCHANGVVQAIDAAMRRAMRQRKEDRRLAMAKLSDFPNRVHLLDRTMDQCPWPLWGDEPGHFHKERFYCGEPSETYGSYCPAHQCAAHDSRVRGTFVTEKKRAANKWTVTAGNWRAA